MAHKDHMAWVLATFPPSFPTALLTSDVPLQSPQHPKLIPVLEVLHLLFSLPHTIFLRVFP